MYSGWSIPTEGGGRQREEGGGGAGEGAREGEWVRQGERGRGWRGGDRGEGERERMKVWRESLSVNEYICLA